MSQIKITITSIHKNFVPKYDRWHGRLVPRIVSWFEHMGEITLLSLKGDKPYSKYGRIVGTCREHAVVEVGDWLWLTAEVIWMITKIELPIVPQKTLVRVWNKMEDSKKESEGLRDK